MIVERRQIPERMRRKVVELALVEAEAAEHLRIGQHLLGVQAAVDPAQHVLATRIVAIRQVELADVAPVSLVAGLRELLGASIGVETVRQPLRNVKTWPPVRFDASSTVTSCPRRAAPTRN